MKALLPNIIRTVFRRMTLIATLGLSLSAVWSAWAAPPFTDNGNGTVTDDITSLMWDQCPYGLSGPGCASGTVFHGDWASALATATSANTANYKGHNDWRVPNNRELESIVNLSAVRPAIDTAAFPGTPPDWFWSSTTYTPVPSNAWVVNFGNGGTSAGGKSNSFYVRLVRSGQSLASFDSLSTPPPAALVPTLSEWTMAAFAALIVVVGLVVGRRRADPALG